MRPSELGTRDAEVALKKGLQVTRSPSYTDCGRRSLRSASRVPSAGDPSRNSVFWSGAPTIPCLSAVAVSPFNRSGLMSDQG